jgi:hypothetical protein
MLSSDRVVVFRGEGRQSLSIYGQDGSVIGSAVRVKDDYKQVGFRYHYELRDTELRCVLRDVTRRRLGVDSLPYSFSVLGADGADIGAITQSGRGMYDHLTSSAWHVDDEPGHPVAKITYAAPRLTGVVTYVVELASP